MTKKENKEIKKSDKKDLNSFLIKVVQEQKTIIYDRTTSRRNKEMLEHIEKSLEEYL